MQEVGQQAYSELVQELLTCAQGEEQDLLAANPDLIDKQLVETMFAIVQVLSQQDEQQQSTARWLNNFALKLAEQLGLDFGRDNSEIQLQFLLNVLQTVADSNGDYQIIYPLLSEHLELLNYGIIEVLKAWARDQFTQAEKADRTLIATIIGEFGDLIHRLPDRNQSYYQKFFCKNKNRCS